MKALGRYVLTMSGTSCVYRLTILELAKRGYPLKNARDAVKTSGLLEHARKSWKVTRDMGPSEWADYVEANAAQRKMLVRA